MKTTKPQEGMFAQTGLEVIEHEEIIDPLEGLGTSASQGYELFKQGKLTDEQMK